MPIRLATLLLTLFLSLIAGVADAQTFPALSGRVVDAAHLLSPAQTQQITALSEATEKASGRQLVVATIPDLQGYPIEDYGYRLGRAWKIGQQGANNGIVLIVAPNDRKVRIEVGYGLEPIMTDALSQGIIDDTILPKFRAGDMGGGIVDGATAIAEQLKLPPEEAEKRASAATAEATAAPRRHRSDSNGGVAIFWIIVVLVIVLPMIVGRARGRRYRGGRAPVIVWGPGIGGGWGSGWSGGGSSWGSSGGGDWGGGGGGGFSGGGGSFGGGGASGGW